MKRSILAGFTGILFLFSCGNNNMDHNDDHSDSTGHNMSGNQSTNHPEMNTGTTGSNLSMMDMMNKNMQDMKALQSTGNPDNDFAALMKVHHMGALEMAQVEAAQGTDEEMKRLAGEMIGEQQKEIAELNTFLSGHSAHGGGDNFYKEVMSQMEKMKMEMDHSGSIDKQFVQMMIPHHQGAIDMARAYLKSGGHEEKLKTIANKIIADQQKEIQVMQNWLSRNK